MFKANGQRTSEYDRDVRKVLPHIYSEKSRMLTLQKRWGALAFNFQFPNDAGMPGTGSTSHKTGRCCHLQVGVPGSPKSQPWDPTRGMDLAAAVDPQLRGICQRDASSCFLVSCSESNTGT